MRLSCSRERLNPMADEVYWIPIDLPGRLGTMARPRGGDWLTRDLVLLKRRGVTSIVSLLEPDEARELGLASEAVHCEDAGLDFSSYPIPDRKVPLDTATFWSFAEGVHSVVESGAVVAVHCRAGIGRSSLLAAAVLNLSGMKVDDAFALISRARGLDVPDTIDQRKWLEVQDRGPRP